MTASHSNAILGVCLGLILITGGVGQSAQAHSSRVLLDDRHARVTVVTLAPRESMVITGATTYGTVWVPLNDKILSEVIEEPKVEADWVFDGTGVRTISAGGKVSISNSDSSPARVVIVDVKSGYHLSLDGVSLGIDNPGSEEDSTENDTLLIPQTPVRFRDVKDTGGDPLDTHLEKPRTIRLEPGQVGWLREGRHVLTNLLGKPVRYVLVEFGPSGPR